ncbi:MAG: hypothetical protein L0177_00895 [Chloroflexi bacterium]|nr:hypothetical protein [Chloroflexota bacterium]
MTQLQERTSVPVEQLESGEQAVRLCLHDFQRMLRESGIEARPLEITRIGSFMSVRTMRRTIYRVTWPHQRKIRLFGLRFKEWTGRKSGAFVKHRVDELAMPMQAEVIAATVRDRPEIEETAVFVETRTDPILAVRVEGQWIELYRWFTRPTFV